MTTAYIVEGQARSRTREGKTDAFIAEVLAGKNLFGNPDRAQEHGFSPEEQDAKFQAEGIYCAWYLIIASPIFVLLALAGGIRVGKLIFEALQQI